MTARALLPFAVLLAGCTTIPPGYVGIKVDQWGTNRGVEDYPIKTGRVTYNLVTTSVYEYPTFVQTAKWVRDANEGAAHDQSITFSSKEGSQFNVDVGISFSFLGDSVPHLFVKYRQNPEHILDNIIRNAVRKEFNRFAGQMPALGLVGPLKEQLTDSVTAALAVMFAPDGIIIQQVSLLSSPRPLDEKVQQSIDNAVKATNDAIAAENAVRRATAMAAQARAFAQGQADSLILMVEAQAKANERLSASLTPSLVEYMKAQRWDGHLPQVSGGNAIPMITFGK